MIDFNSPSGPVMSSPRSRAALTSSAIAARSLADAVDDDVLFFASLGIALTPLIVSVIGDQPSRRHPPACQAGNTVWRTVPGVAPDRSADLGGGVSSHGVQDVLVASEEDGLAPAHEAHDDAAVDALSEEKRGCGVSGVVEAGWAYAGFGQEHLPCVVVGAGVYRGAVRLGEDQVVVMPGAASSKAFVGLGPAVVVEVGEHLWGYRQGSSAGAALGVVEAEAAAVSAGASRGGVRGGGIVAAVLPREALELAADGEGAGVEVEVAPRQCEGFALAQSEREGDGPSCAVSFGVGDP